MPHCRVTAGFDDRMPPVNSVYFGPCGSHPRVLACRGREALGLEDEQPVDLDDVKAWKRQGFGHSC